MFLSTTYGLFTGSLLGLLGGGGSIIAVPILVYALGMTTKSAIGTSLLIVGIASLFGAVSHYKQKHVLLKVALLFGSAGAVGSIAGGILARSIADFWQLIMFSGAMAVIGLIMLLKKERQVTRIDPGNRTPLVLISGVGAGILTGLLGVGGGFIIVPALTLTAELPIKQAVGTSLAIIAINSLVGATTYTSHIRLDSPVLAFAGGALAAAPVAGHISQYIKQERLRTLFASTLLLLAACMLFKQFAGY